MTHPGHADEEKLVPMFYLITISSHCAVYPETLETLRLLNGKNVLGCTNAWTRTNAVDHHLQGVNYCG
jgi:hypothetical protein